MTYLWACLFMVLGILGGELVGWLRQQWLARYRPVMTIEEATEHLKVELAEHRRLTEEAMWRALFDQEE